MVPSQIPKHSAITDCLLFVHRHSNISNQLQIMLRSSQSFLKQASRTVARSPVSTASSSKHISQLLCIRASSTANAAGAVSDYDRIMGTSSLSAPVGNSDYNNDTMTPATSSFSTYSTAMLSAKTNCYHTIDEPSGCEDYDNDTLHHPPCSTTQELNHYVTPQRYYDEGYRPK